MRVNTPTVVNPRVRVIPAKVETGRDDANPDGEKKKIAVYARVSTMEEEQQSSQELQESYFKEMIAKNENWELYKIYADHGVTGTNTKNRTAFNEMIEDAKEQQFDIIITKSISRFARNTLDCLTYVRMLKGLKKPVGVIFDRERISSLDSSSEMLLTIIASISEEESKTISANVCWGVTKRFSQGIPHIPTTYFLGYDEDEEGNLIINEEEAKTVRRIYKELLAGKGTVVIAKELTRDKVKTARGNTKWTSDSVLKLLRNEKYAGHALCQKSVTLDPLTHKRVRNKKHKPQYFIRNHHPPIISEEDWNEAQKELDRRSKMLHDPGGKYRRAYSGRAPFSNMFFCGTCGMPIIRRRITSNNKEKKYHFTTIHSLSLSKSYPSIFTALTSPFSNLFTNDHSMFSEMLRLSSSANKASTVNNIELDIFEVFIASFSNITVMPFSLSDFTIFRVSKTFLANREIDLHRIISISPAMALRIILLNPVRLPVLVPDLPLSENTPTNCHSLFDRM
jgi:site-specific DNA recombinase